MPNRAQTSAATQSSRSSSEDQRISNKILEAQLPEVRRKSPRKPNLHVAFATTAPAVIGEGGDEAMLPAREVLSYVATSAKPPTEAPGKVQRSAHVSDRTEVYNKDVDLLRPRPLQRRSTGLQNSEPDEVSEHDAHATVRHSDVELEPDHFPETVMHGEASASLRRSPPRGSPRFDVTFSRHDDNDADELPCDDSNRKGSGLLQEAQSHLLNPATSFTNSLTPSASPSPKQFDNSPERAYPFPATTPFKEPKSDLTNLDSQAQMTQQQSPPGSSTLTAENRGLSLRNVAMSFGDDALQEFLTRVQPFRNVFLLGLDTRAEPTLEQWVTAASWWFIKGRSGLESSVRLDARSAVPNEFIPTELPQILKQAYVDLAKAFWITSEITPNRYPEVQKLETKGTVPIASIVRTFLNVKTAELVQRHLAVASNLRALTMSMKRNNRMPPSGLELQGLDVRIFVPYPSLSPSAARLLSSDSPGEVAVNKHIEGSYFFPMPVSDTERHFNYGRMFVDVLLAQTKPEYQVRIPCLLSVLRERTDRDITIVIASQDGQVHLVVQPDANQRLSWRDVRWKTQHRYMEIDLRTNFDLQVYFDERDFKTIWGIHDYVHGVQKRGQATKSESLLYENILGSFQYFEQGKPAARFPAEVIGGCTLRLFECFTVVMEGCGERRLHDGYRIMAVTPCKLKTLSSVSHHVGQQTPIVFSYLRDGQGAPAIFLKTSKSSRDPSMVMSFKDQAERDHLHSLLSGTGLSTCEHYSNVLDLENVRVSVDNGQEKPSLQEVGGLESSRWRNIRVIGQETQNMQLGNPKVRVWAECESGCLVDPVNLGPGELQIGLDSDFFNRISICRPPQKDMTVCFADNTLSKEQYEALQQMLDQVGSKPSIKTFGFHTLQALHEFQALVTGFSVLFDGFARTFAISRRRMVVPIHKRWEASVTRMQIVRRDKTMQLVAFFKDFSHGSCMNFALKSTDVFESFTRSGIAYLSIVDAKFALPKGETDPYSKYICLDMPEYPGEHDDITIGFESEHDRDNFSKTLPATVNQLSRIGSLRRQT
ncbi:MAG: hypothetical protein Q9209_005611 [Squamulea sp. 1 TL-2023]